MGNPVQRYQPIDTNLFIENRKRLSGRLAPNSIAVLHANDIMPKDGDDVIGFKQNSDLFYLTGLDQEETILVLYPDAPKKQWREMLFIKKTNPHIARWEGDKYTQEGATQVSGVSQVYWLEDFPMIWRQAVLSAEGIYLNTNEHLRANTQVESRNDRFIKDCQTQYPLHRYYRLAPIMAALRAIKSAAEIALIRHACTITRDGFQEVLPHIKEGVMEYALEASLASSFLARGSRGFAYAPIIASGERANILHYIHNSQPCAAGELILFDVGAEYAGYAADMTRVVPVSGRFTPRQKEVYEAVLRVMEASKSLLNIGTTLPEYEKEVGKVMEGELVRLGLLSTNDIAKQKPQQPAYKKYFMHNTSHHLGLGIHDFANMGSTIRENMVFTIEPGIYIPEEGIGIRLENNFVVKENGLQDLMSDIPLTVEEIEEACAQAARL